MDGVLSVLTEQTVDGIALWVVALICVGVFLASFMDAIAGGGGIISVPTYLMALHTLPTYYALGTNKLSACIGTVFSTGRYIRGGYVEWRLFGPGSGAESAGLAGRDLAAAPDAGYGLEIFAAGGAAGGGGPHPAGAQLAGMRRCRSRRCAGPRWCGGPLW